MKKVFTLFRVNKFAVRAVLDAWSPVSPVLQRRARVINAFLSNPDDSVSKLAKDAGVTPTTLRKIIGLFQRTGISGLMPRYSKRGLRRDKQLESAIRAELKKSNGRLTRSEIATKCGSKIWVVNAVAAKYGIVRKQRRHLTVGKNDICTVTMRSGHGMIFGYSNRPFKRWGKRAASFINLPGSVRHHPDERILHVVEDLWRLFQLARNNVASNPGRRALQFLADVERRWPVAGSLLLFESSAVAELPAVIAWRKRHRKECLVRISNPLLLVRDDAAKINRVVATDHPAFVGDNLPWFVEVGAILNWHHPSSRDYRVWEREKAKLFSTS